MKAFTSLTDGILTVTVDGEINTLTAPELAKSVSDLSGVSELIFDLDRVPYVSSAGLRLFLTCQRTVTASGGRMLVKNCDEFVVEIFESVGYNRFIRLETKNGDAV